jgi:hypothetical protein
MNPLKPGIWRIDSVEVNSKAASDCETFRQLLMSEREIRLEPAGITFYFQQATARSAILESRSQIFFADFTTRGQRLTLVLSRPAFSETVSLQATFEAEGGNLPM